jgi:hypothetical protein
MSYDNNRSFRALIGRQFDTATAERLVSAGYSLAKLQLLTRDKLIGLEIPEHLVTTLLDEQRPPVPDPIVRKLLVDSRYRCCVCHEPDKSLILHHIVEWSASRDNSEENLAVLCLNDHGEAHTTRLIGRNLTADVIREAKRVWTSQGYKDTADKISKLSQSEYATWDYINHSRLHSLLQTAGIDPRSSRYASLLQSRGFHDSLGLIQDVSEWGISKIPSQFMYDFGGATPLYLHNEWLLRQLLPKLELRDLTGRWSRSLVQALVTPGTMVVCQGAFYFRNEAKAQEGRNQLRKAKRRENNVQLSYNFDAWECTSNTAHTTHLTGKSVATSICLIRGIEENKGMLELTATCIAMGTGFPRIVPPTDVQWLHDAYGNTEEEETEPDFTNVESGSVPRSFDEFGDEDDLPF